MQICLLLSVMYHIFGCHSEKSRRHFLRLDLFGISAAYISIYLSGIYTAFFCFEVSHKKKIDDLQAIHLQTSPKDSYPRISILRGGTVANLELSKISRRVVCLTWKIEAIYMMTANDFAKFIIFSNFQLQVVKFDVTKIFEKKNKIKIILDQVS